MSQVLVWMILHRERPWILHYWDFESEFWKKYTFASEQEAQAWMDGPGVEVFRERNLLREDYRIEQVSLKVDE